MSKFIEKLKRNAQMTPQPMGFGRFTPAKVESGMLIIAAVTQVDKNLAEYVAGADAVILPSSEVRAGVKNLQKATQVAPDVLWGVHAHDISESDAKEIVGAGGDFVVFGMDSIPLVSEEKVPGKVLEVDMNIDDHLLRTVDDLPIDGVLISDKREGALNWQQLMRLQYLSALFSKPLMVSAPNGVSSSEIQLLWEAGVDGIKVEVGPGITANLKELHEQIEKLDLPSLRKQKKTTAILPRLSEERVAARGPEPDDDEEEEPD